MVSEVRSMTDTYFNLVGDKPATRSIHNKKSTTKVPKKIHKAEREKQKRDHLNVLFMELGDTLESLQPNSGKASILSDTTRLLRDLLGQIKSLKKENKVLLYESHYVTAEKNELKEENSALEAKIDKLQRELQEKNITKSAWKVDLSRSQHTIENPLMVPLYVVPSEAGLGEVTSMFPRSVSKPQARYPSSSDVWPSKILAKQANVSEQAQQSCTTSSRES